MRPAIKTLLTIAITAIATTVLVGSCSFRLGTACGYYDGGMALQTCLKGPPFVKKP